jgi:STE24 endopeptidase
MSEMTAIRVGILGTLAAAWLAVAALLWRTSVPELHPPSLDPATVFGRAALARNARYEYVLTSLWALSVLALLGALWLAARRAPRPRGPALVSGALFGGGVFVLAWLVDLPFHLIAHWWRRRYDVTDLGYLRFVTGTWSTTLGELVLACLAGVALVGAGRLLGSRAWLGLWAAFVALAAAYVLLYPTLLAPRLRPLEDKALAAQIETLGRRAGLEHTEVEVRKARERTRAINAEALGAGPTTRLILWDTLLEPQVGRGEIRFVAAHELTHIARHHPWKGVAWFALLALPGTWLLARSVTLRDPREIPRTALVLVLLQLATLPLANGISRRYEAEADWQALQLTGDSGSAEALYRRFTRTNLTDPDPPWLLHVLLDTHPSLLERVATARAAALRADPGSRAPSRTSTTSP